VPVVFDGADGAAVIALTAQKSGLPPAELDAVPLDRLLTGPPQLLGDAVMRRCSGAPSTMSVVRADLARAEAAWVKKDTLAAIDHLDLAVTQLGCLSEIVETAAAARIFMLRAELELNGPNPDDAGGELRTAVAFAPDIAWTATSVDGSTILDEERAAEATAVVAVVPAASGAGPWIDGRGFPAGSTEMTVTPGLHLVQHGTPAGIRSAWLLVGGDATLVVPGNYRRPVLDAMLAPETRHPVEALLATTLPNFRAGYVSHAEGLWLVTLEEGVVSTTEIAAPPPPAPPPEDGKKKKKKGKSEN
jgi:hypothetical protein